MLDLITKLDSADHEKIANYIYLHAIDKDNYLGNICYLNEWAKNKTRLYHLLGGNLMIKQPVCIEKDHSVINQELKCLKAGSFYDHFDNFLMDTFDKVEKNDEEIKFNDIIIDKHSKIHRIKLEFTLMDLINQCCYYNSTVTSTIKIQLSSKKKMLQIQKGMKPIKAIQKVLSYFDANHSLLNKYEQFRIKQSMILNDKILKGNLVISIHPLDFMTMSDNNMNWTSCMSWVRGGCYRQGTVEMMNSNNIVCCYLESDSNSYYFGTTDETDESCTWNNKKWRALACVTNDIILMGKNYPYHSDALTLEALKILRKLAGINLKRHYKYGPELYKDMRHVDDIDSMQHNRDWIAFGETTKKNILIDTHAMYNDFLNCDPNLHNFWCVRNKVKHNKIISISGKALCPCCNQNVLVEDDFYEDYNDRYCNTGEILCQDCLDDLKCYGCDIYDPQNNYIEIDGHYYCEECIENYVRQCPDCGSLFEIDKVKPLYLKVDETYKSFNHCLKDNNTNYASLYCCHGCKMDLIDTGMFEDRKLSGWRYGYVKKGETTDEDMEEFKRYFYDNLKRIN